MLPFFKSFSSNASSNLSIDSLRVPTFWRLSSLHWVKIPQILQLIVMKMVSLFQKNTKSQERISLLDVFIWLPPKNSNLWYFQSNTISLGLQFRILHFVWLYRFRSKRNVPPTKYFQAPVNKLWISKDFIIVFHWPTGRCNLCKNEILPFLYQKNI